MARHAYSLLDPLNERYCGMLSILRAFTSALTSPKNRLVEHAARRWSGAKRVSGRLGLRRSETRLRSFGGPERMSGMIGRSRRDHWLVYTGSSSLRAISKSYPNFMLQIVVRNRRRAPT